MQTKKILLWVWGQRKLQLTFEVLQLFLTSLFIQLVNETMNDLERN